MPISSVDRVKSITLPLNSADGSNIVTIYQSNNLTVGSELMTDYTIVSFNCFLKNLKAFAEITSLPEVPLPDFLVEDSETDKLYKTLDIEWKSPRKQLSLYVASNNQEWFKVGSVSLLNPSGYPFRIYNLMDLFTDNLAMELGENSRIGISVDPAGYGLLEVGDTVTIHGSYVEEIYLLTKETPININVTVEGGQVATTTSDHTFGNSTYLGNSSLIGN